MKLIAAIVLLCSFACGQISGPGSFTESVSPFSTDQAKNVPPSVNDITFSHSMLALPNPLLVVECVTNNWPGTKVLSVSANGQAMQEVDDLKGLARNKPTDTAAFVLAGLPAGSVSIHATSGTGATNGYGLECLATDMYGVDQANPVEFVDSDNVPPDTPSVSCTVTPQQDGDALLILEYSTAYNQSSPVSAVPFPTDIVSGRFSGEQIGIAHALNLHAGQQYTETWTEHLSKVSTQWSIIGLILRPAL